MADYSNPRAVMGLLGSMGVPARTALGFTGAMGWESGPTLHNNALNYGDGADGSNSIGWGQWNGSRGVSLRNIAAGMGTSWQDPQANLAQIRTELNGPYKSVLNQLRSVDDTYAGARIGTVNYENPKIKNVDQRYQRALEMGRAMYPDGDYSSAIPASTIQATAPTVPSVPAIDQTTAPATGVATSPFKRTLAGATIGGMVGGVPGALVGAALPNFGALGQGVSSLLGSSVFGGPQVAASNQPVATARDAVQNAAPSVLARINSAGVQAPKAGMHIGYSPFGNGLSYVSDTAPDSVQIAASGPGFFGALSDGLGLGSRAPQVPAASQAGPQQMGNHGLLGGLLGGLGQGIGNAVGGIGQGFGGLLSGMFGGFGGAPVGNVGNSNEPGGLGNSRSRGGLY